MEESETFFTHILPEMKHKSAHNTHECISALRYTTHGHTPENNWVPWFSFGFAGVRHALFLLFPKQRQLARLVMTIYFFIQRCIRVTFGKNIDHVLLGFILQLYVMIPSSQRLYRFFQIRVFSFQCLDLCINTNKTMVTR